MKKRLALFLVLALLMSMLPTTSLAVEDTIPKTTSAEQSTDGQLEVTVPEEETSSIHEDVQEKSDVSMETPDSNATPEESQEPESDTSAVPDLPAEAVTSSAEESNAQPELKAEEGNSEENVQGQEIPAQEETLVQEPSMAGEEDIVASGTCGAQGDNLTWTLDGAGTLTISGSGDMVNYEGFGEDIDLAPWRAYKDQIQNIVVEEGVTSIGDYAFGVPSRFGGTSYLNLSKVTLPDGLNYIGSASFYGCSGLEDVVVPDSVTQIGESAFYGCASLKEMTIPQNVTSLGDSAFTSCSELTKVVIAGNLGCIDRSTFASCSKLSSVVITGNVTSIESNAFYNCKELSEITIPSSMTGIDSSAFSGCTSLSVFLLEGGNQNYSVQDGVLYSKDQTKLVLYPLGKSGSTYTIPDGVTSIGEYAFSGCSQLSSVLIPDSVASIENNAFRGCQKLESVTIPEQVSIIDWSAFESCTSLTNVTILGSAVKIGNYAFSGCTNLTDVMVRGSVSSIGSNAFSSCSRLVNISLPEGLTSIADGAFQYCTSLPSIAIPNSVTSIGDYAFASCSSLINVNIPQNCQTGAGIFNGCNQLADEDGNIILGTVFYSYNGTGTTCIIPDGITEIAAGAFRSAYRLTQVTIPNGVVKIGDSAFYYCDTLLYINIPDSVNEIGDYCFYSCTGLTEIKVPDGCHLGESAFEYCSGLVDDDGFLIVGGKLFQYTGSEKELAIPEGVTEIDAYVFQYNDLMGVTFPDSLVSIGERAFFYCTSLTELALPDSLIKIGESAFKYCDNLRSINIGSGLEQMEIFAFGECNGLTDIQVSAENENYKSEDGVLFSKDGKELILYPAAKEVQEYAIGSDVTTVAYAAFANASNLASVSIPKSVTSIGAWAFAKTSLSEVTFAGDAPTFESDIDDSGYDWGKGTFAGVTATGYYPEGYESWTEELMQDIGRNMTWEAFKLPGVAVSGTITSWEQDSDAEYLLYDSQWSYAEIRADLALETPQLALSVGTGGAVSSGSGGSYKQIFTFDGVEAGTYKLAICKSAKYVPQVVTVTVGDGDIDLGDLSLQPVGDASGDGTVTIIDAALANSYARGTGELEEYTLACADVSGNDGKVTIIDAARINAHARGTASLWE